MTGAEPTVAQDLDKGDEISWNWGGGKPSGEVVGVYEDKKTIQSKRGNDITRNGTEENPAIEIKQKGGNPVLKKASEINEVETGS